MMSVIMLSVVAPKGECNGTIMKRSSLEKVRVYIYTYTSKIIYNMVGLLSI
jgi:hypothetical protein